MSAGLTRRELFRPGNRRRAVRPPWAAAEDQFVAQCDRCRACLGACPQGILLAGDGGFPVVEFQRGGCTFCGDCAEVCRTGALRRGDRAPWALVAAIGDRCLSVGGVACRVCGDRCEDGALRFRPAVGGRSRPEVDAARCTGCGACVRPCPTGAVRVGRIEAEVAECA